ncbi:MAG: beta-Ala-His dipeptidase [Clostridia bacterium]|nr:beta-Ala-His dipeptidase [Clostridia bacterium]
MTYGDLEPKIVFSYFKKLSDIPRGSGNERAAAVFVRDTAIALGHEADIDAANNVFVRAKASPGYEGHAPVMLQGHLDMVCEANRGTVHDFLKDPIELVLTGDELRANGTTLGADDGVATAVILSILAQPELPHPALECLFTTEEETGLNGMRTFDPSRAKALRLINLDSAGEGEATVSCAGGVRSHVLFTPRKAPVGGESVLTVEVSGFAGGHSGEDIDLGRKNAIVTLARILYAASKAAPFRLVSFAGGNRDNAIPRECTASVAAADPDAFRGAAKAEIDAIAAECIPDDASFRASVEEAAAREALTPESTVSFLTLLSNLPNGVHGMSRAVPGLVETSSNLAVVRENADCYEIVVSSRSSVESMLDWMQNRVECAALPSGASVEHVSRYPGWDYLEGSPMQQLYLETWKACFGTEARVIGIHAGLECGILKGKLPDMDMISIGPDIKNLHSPDEVLNVRSLARMYELVCAMLKKA